MYIYIVSAHSARTTYQICTIFYHLMTNIEKNTVKLSYIVLTITRCASMKCSYYANHFYTPRQATSIKYCILKVSEWLVGNARRSIRFRPARPVGSTLAVNLRNGCEKDSSAQSQKVKHLCRRKSHVILQAPNAFTEHASAFSKIYDER